MNQKEKESYEKGFKDGYLHAETFFKLAEIAIAGAVITTILRKGMKEKWEESKKKAKK